MKKKKDHTVMMRLPVETYDYFKKKSKDLKIPTTTYMKIVLNMLITNETYSEDRVKQRMMRAG